MQSRSGLRPPGPGGNEHEAAAIGLAIVDRAGLAWPVGHRSPWVKSLPGRRRRLRRARARPRPEQVVLSAIRSNPADGSLSRSWRRGKRTRSSWRGGSAPSRCTTWPSGWRSTSAFPFRDDLVIDTGMAHVVAQSAAAGMAGRCCRARRASQSRLPYIYPPPLFGRLDDPFFGYVPPLVSYPPWWSRGNQTRFDDGAARKGPGAAAADRAAPAAGAPNAGWRPLEVDPVKGQVEISVDMAGQVFLRGAVVSEQAAREIDRRRTQCSGRDRGLQRVASRPPASRRLINPPPPPVPMPAAPKVAERPRPRGRSAPAPAVVPARPKPATELRPALDSQALTAPRRGLARAAAAGCGLARQGALDRRRRHAVRPGPIGLRGHARVPGRPANAGRARDRRPPRIHRPRRRPSQPPAAKRPARRRRALPGLADSPPRRRSRPHRPRPGPRRLLELRGTIQNAGDHDRLLAILRSIPVLHGFRLEPEFNADNDHE